MAHRNRLRASTALASMTAALLSSLPAAAQYMPTYGYPVYMPGGYAVPGSMGMPGGVMPGGYAVPGQVGTPGQAAQGNMVIMPGQAQAVFVAPPAQTAAGSPPVVAVDPPGGLEGYNAPGGNAPGSGSSTGIRTALVERSARAQGLLDGYNAEVQRLNEATDKISSRFAAYAFEPLLVDDTVIPPVITEVRERGTQKSDTVLSLAMGTYRIVVPARLAIKVPNWRDYLFFSEPPRSVRASEFQPRSKEEKQVWQATFDEAVREGVAEAREAYAVNMARLVRDYQGMKLYHELARTGAISLPKISREQRALTITEAGSRAAANSLEIKVIVQPRFNPKAPPSAYLRAGASVAPPAPAVPAPARTSVPKAAPPAPARSSAATPAAEQAVGQPLALAPTKAAKPSEDPWGFARGWTLPASTASAAPQASPQPATASGGQPPREAATGAGVATVSFLPPPTPVPPPKPSQLPRPGASPIAAGQGAPKAVAAATAPTSRPNSAKPAPAAADMSLPGPPLSVSLSR